VAGQVQGQYALLPKARTSVDSRTFIIPQRDKVSAVVAIVNFLLMSAGSQREWVAEDVDLEALEAEELDVLVRIYTLSSTASAIDSCLLSSSVYCSCKT